MGDSGHELLVSEKFPRSFPGGRTDVGGGTSRFFVLFRVLESWRIRPFFYEYEIFCFFCQQGFLESWRIQHFFFLSKLDQVVKYCSRKVTVIYTGTYDLYLGN